MEKPRAWADAPDHIVVHIGNAEHGYDLKLAQELLVALQSAIFHAEMLRQHEKRVLREASKPVVPSELMKALSDRRHGG